MEGRLSLLMGLLWLCGSFGNLTATTAQSSMKLHNDESTYFQFCTTKLKVGFWNFSVDPCSGTNEWISTTFGTRNVTCGNCSVTTNICHVTSIELKSQNLGGVLPEEFANLTFLTKIDLSRNYLNGTIPTSWASLPLQYIAIMVNRISGMIPDEIGKIATLQHLDVEGNLLEGPIPSTIGALTNLIRICLNTNNFSGELPSALGNLKILRDFRINGNTFSGRIPSFIGNWKNLKRLHMQGTSLEGPFPHVFSTLTSLEELIVTDMDGGGEFPSLMYNVKMKNIILRNCSITGEIPPYIGNLMNLRRIDLSFNKLSGEIPASWNGLRFISNMYLTNNNLSGSIPNWMFGGAKKLDLSYNSFTGPPLNSCPEGNLNLVSSFSSSENNTINSCLRRGFPCQQKAMNYQLFVNCGGKRVKINDRLYEDDSVNSGPANFFVSEDQRWASSSTGDFLGNSGAYIATNTSVLKNMTNPELYMSGRLTPLSLRYYGLCLQNGTYTVNLHFAEITFTNDQTFSVLGTRIFDVYIQHKKVLGNFNIAKEANGTGRSVVKSFNASVDKDGTLEIHFQWVGKGTISVPYQGVYGPLISAISVTPNFEPDKGKGEKGLSVGVIIGIVVTSVLLGLLIVILFVFCWRKKYKKDDEGLESLTGHFSLRQIKSATNNFDPVNKIGEGGFGPVYKGQLPDGTLIAVKQLSSKSKQGNREFLNEIGIISAVQHPNLVKLFGCCIGGNQLLLIYEYLENNNLARALFGPEGMKLNLQWQRRRKIGIDIARGLAYLHEESRLKIVHRDIKTTNVLLDKDLNAKISDFGLARLDEEENTHVSTRVVGTVGYMAPEYALWGHLSEKADVYSFGIVLLEIISGKSNANYRSNREFVSLLDWAYVEQEEGNMLALVDPALGLDYSKEEAEEMLSLSLLCTNQSPALRPTMSSVVSMLEAHMPVEVPASTESHENAFQHHTQELSNSTDGPSTNSSSDSVQVQGVTTQSLP